MQRRTVWGLLFAGAVALALALLALATAPVWYPVTVKIDWLEDPSTAPLFV